MRDVFDANGGFDPTTATITANGKATTLPVGAADRITGQNGKLVALLGPTLDATFAADGDTDRATVRLTAAAQHLDINANVVLTPDAIAVDDTATAKLTLTPEAWRLLAGETSELVEPIVISADLYRLNLPRAQTTASLPESSVELMLSISDTTMVAPQVGRVVFQGTTVVVQSDRLRTSAIFNVASRATILGKTGSVSIDGDVQQLFTDTGDLNLDGLIANLTGKTRQFPAIVLADALAGQDGRLIKALGPTLDADFEARWKNDAGSFDLTTAVNGESGRADISSNNQFARTDDGGVTLTGTDTTITNLPVALLETLSDQQGKLTTLLGPKIDRIAVNVTGDPRSQAPFKLVVASPRMSADLAGTYRPDGVRLNPDCGGTLIVSPDSFASYLAQTGGEQVGTMRLIDPLVVARVRVAGGGGAARSTRARGCVGQVDAVETRRRAS